MFNYANRSYATPVVMRGGQCLTAPGARAPVFAMIRDRATVTRVLAPPMPVMPAGQAVAPAGVDYDVGIRLEAAEPS